MLLEALGQALRHGHLLLDAARDAALLARRQRLGREVVDARDEAVVDEVAEELLFFSFPHWSAKQDVLGRHRGS